MSDTIIVIESITPQVGLSFSNDQGPQGGAGEDNSLLVGTITTGVAGSTAAVTITGTAPVQTINMTIPRGDTGATGATGATGPTGTSGASILGTNNTFTGTNTFNDEVVIAESGTGNALRITNTGTGNSLLVEDSANPDATPFAIDAAGNVGIGVTPTARLHAYTDSTTAYDFISRTPTVGLTAGNTVNMAYFADSRSTANDGIRIYNLRDTTGSGAGDWPTSSFHIQRNVDGAGYQADIGFGNGTMTFGTQYAERMRIDYSGRVGVGYTPVVGDGIFNIGVGGSGFHIGYGANLENYFTAGTSGIQVFRNLSTERMRITSAGLLLINSTSSTLGFGSVASQLGLVSGAATSVGAVIRGATSQTANLQEWQNSAGTVLAKVDASGNGQFAGIDGGSA